MTQKAILALADGTIFHGQSIGAEGSAVGEVVFNTAMTGYQEMLTDPSYAKQLITLTYPHIGNTGVNLEDTEAGRTHNICASGLIVKEATHHPSSFRSTQSLPDYLKSQGVVAIADIDTRRLTRHLRTHGAQNGCILVGDDESKALAQAKNFSGLNGLDLAKEATDPEGFLWGQDDNHGEWQITDGKVHYAHKKYMFHVVAYDFGSKTNILRMLTSRGCKLTVVPAMTSAAEVLALNPDGIFLSNGPGDPAACDYAIQAVKTICDTSKIPVFGICLGHQLLALASGAKTMKMGHGHHGANHPVQDLDDGTVMITSQNHGFCVDESTLPSTLRATHRSLFDGTNQGIERTDRPAFSFQGHPEASPGPHDCGVLFDRFIELMQQHKISNS